VPRREQWAELVLTICGLPQNTEQAHHFNRHAQRPLGPDTSPISKDHASTLRNNLTVITEPRSNAHFGSRTTDAKYLLQKNFTHDLVYFTEIGIGTPVQRFQVLIDISSPESFVSSVKCKTCAPGDGKYDSSASFSFQSNDTVLEIDGGYIFAGGHVVSDTFDFDGIKAEKQPFLEATTVQPIGLSWDDMSTIHGIVGLTPSSAGSVLNNSSPFMTMVSENVLDRNLFSMRLREPRELLFGAHDSDLFTGDIVQLPLSNKTSRYGLTARWQAEANYLTLGSDPGLRISLAGYTASFSTGSAFILLPDRMVSDIWRDLEFEDLMYMPPSVSCDKLAFMPDIIFNLAGKNFTLTPNDYTFEWPMKPSRTRCATAIMPFGIEQYDEIFLGSAFLRTFYSVFDLDTNTIGCKFTISGTCYTGIS